MNIFIRVDSSIIIGSGHVMRCLTLADTLRAQGTKIIFICRELPGHMCQFIEEKGYEVCYISYNVQDFNYSIDKEILSLDDTWEIDAEKTSIVLQDVSATSIIHWLIVDHYGIDAQWEQRVKPYVQKIMVIDDLANRHHDCDLLLDQNLYIDMQTRYDGLIPEQCQILLGPQYALLRKEFYESRKIMRERDGTVKRVIVFFGGSDPTNETFKALRAIQLLNRKDIYFDIIVGRINPHKKQIHKMCNKMTNAMYYCQVDNIAELMTKADLAIGAGGTATWERLCLGLPSLIITVAENQIEIAKSIDKKKYGIYIGSYINVNIKSLSEVLLECINNSIKMKKMSSLASKVIDGQGDKKISNILRGQ